MSAPRYFPKGEKELKILQGARRDENRRTLNFPDLHPVFVKNVADCGDKVENRPSFREIKKRAPKKFSFVDEKFGPQY